MFGNSVRSLMLVLLTTSHPAWLPLTPGASPIDGLLDVFIMRRTSERDIFARLLKRQLRLAGTAPLTFVCRSRHVAVASPRRAPDDLHLTPRQLPVVVSSKTAEALAQGLVRAGGFSQASRCHVA